MLMHDVNRLLPSAIRSLRSSLRDISRQKIPFTVDGLVRLGLPAEQAGQLRELSGTKEAERLVVASFIYDLFAMNCESYEAKDALGRWLEAHTAGEEHTRTREAARAVLVRWHAEEFGPGVPECAEAAGTAQQTGRSFVYRMF